MNLLKIQTPIWNGGRRKVGIATYRLQDREIYIEILKKDKHGNRIYPGKFKIECEKVKSYPTMLLKKANITVHLVPIEDLEPCF